MPLSSQQRARVLANIDSGRLPLDAPQKMYAGYGDGSECSGCGEEIDKKQVEYEALYQSGQALRLHLGCAGLWDAERRRREQTQGVTDESRQIRERSQATREQARMTAKDSQQIRDRADILAREAESVIEESRRVKRGDE